MLELLRDPQAWIALGTLTALEIVLGIDNIIFISILSGRLPANEQNRARRLGLGLAMFMRIGLLLSIAWIMSLTSTLFTVMGNEISGRDLILIAGGLFLVGKSTHEMHAKLEGEDDDEHDAADGARRGPSFVSVIVQILLLDIVFSLDSVITAVGMAEHVEVMIAAVVLAVGVMFVFAKPVGDFVERHPTVKMLALSFLTLIGVTLFADGMGFHIPKGYVYSAMGFSVLVEMLNLRLRKKSKAPVRLHSSIGDASDLPGRGPRVAPTSVVPTDVSSR
jgi:predicted tellurium resistance membrane protein TerC